MRVYISGYGFCPVVGMVEDKYAVLIKQQYIVYMDIQKFFN